MQPINLLTQPSWVKQYAWICLVVLGCLTVSGIYLYTRFPQYAPSESVNSKAQYSLHELQLAGYFHKFSEGVEHVVGIVKAPEGEILVNVGSEIGCEKGKVVNIEPASITLCVPGQKELFYIREAKVD